MALSLGLGMALQGSAYRSGAPILIGFSNNSSGNPTPPAHQAGDLLIAAATTGNGTAAAVPSGWTDWGSLSTNISIRVVYCVAAGSGTTISWTGGVSGRPCWVFRNALRDDLQMLTAATLVAPCAWPDLTIASQAYVGVMAWKEGAQSNIAVVAPAGITWTNRLTKNTATAAWMADSTSLLTSFTPADGTFDNSTGRHCIAAFSIKSAL